MFEAGPESDLVNQVLTNYLQKFWNDQLTAEQALANAKQDIERGRAEIFNAMK